MRTILCLQHFRAADPLRQAEIDRCLAHNLRHPALAEAVVWVEPGAPPPPNGTVPTQFRPLARRLRFADWLRLARESDDAIVVLANADISLEGGFERLEPLLREPEVALALTRREAAAAGREPQLAADPHWRQDCWAIRSDAPIDAALLGAAELPLGCPGSDNRIAHVLWCHGLRLCNPVLHLGALHHQQGRSGPYDRRRDRLFGACAYVHPSLAPGAPSELEHWIWSRQPAGSGGLGVQVEPGRGEGVRQPYRAVATLDPDPDPDAPGGAVPFQGRLALAALRERARPLASHELAVRSPGWSAPLPWAAGLFLPLADLRGGGSRLTPLLPQRLAGLALRLPRSPSGGRLRLGIGLAGEGGEELWRDWPIPPGQAGESLLPIPPDWPSQPIAWVHLALGEGTELVGEGEAFAELQLLVECPPGGDSPRHLGRWGGRFVLEREDEGLMARDRFWPGGRRLSGLRGDTPHAWFAQAFVPPLLEWKPDWIPARPGHGGARLHWQGAAIEAAARERHARLAPAGAHGWEREWERGDPLHTYVGLPWSAFLRGGSLPERLLAAYAARIRAVADVLAQAGRTLRVHTVCQAPDWGPLEACWRELGVSDLWLCGAGPAAGEGDGIRHHAWPALAEEAQGRRAPGAAIPVDWCGRPLLAGFRGGGEAGASLASLAGTADVRLEHGESEDPALGEGDSSAEMALLSRCRYALCPGGRAADPGRLWRALAAGAVPVLLGESPWLPAAEWLLPDQPGLWGEVALGWPGWEATGLLERLRAIDPLEWSARQLLGGRVLRAARERTCFGAPLPS